jgi:hypothetical protein
MIVIHMRRDNMRCDKVLVFEAICMAKSWREENWKVSCSTSSHKFTFTFADRQSFRKIKLVFHVHLKRTQILHLLDQWCEEKPDNRNDEAGSLWRAGIQPVVRLPGRVIECCKTLWECCCLYSHLSKNPYHFMDSKKYGFSWSMSYGHLSDNL